MHRPPPRAQQPLVERLPGEGVAEADRAAVRRLLQQPCLHGPLNHRVEGLLPDLGDRRPQAQRHLLADHRGDRQQPPGLLSEPRHALVQHLAQHRG